MVPRISLVVLVAALAFLGGCGDGDESATPPAGSGPGAADTCGGAAATVGRRVQRPEVTSVTVVGECTTVMIDTKLADSDIDAAREICDRAGEVAYAGGVTSVRVQGTSGRELANGIPGGKCLGG
ncbi:hypothetical protein F4553_007324 [Allocatelliglobosispora scoriae]|uniref:DUF4156 domain-containing protein n=1 Tax=Allocatelliglobosispora scoriae TaxID=643052 RepID=A0A841C4J5_9ACTN|nr:hypothetical protein [Allocatelliglobosispora scoriae]MBB5873890.1 hypothetical protein [Allocatelliglobosispora scoriae]